MENEWIITIRVTPHSQIPEKWVGGKYQKYRVNADGIGRAKDLADAIVMGIGSNPDVWMSTIEGIILNEG